MREREREIGRVEETPGEGEMARHRTVAVISFLCFNCLMCTHVCRCPGAHSRLCMCSSEQMMIYFLEPTSDLLFLLNTSDLKKKLPRNLLDPE